ncbi:MAG TPA: M20/M25/M40 family metallo-hydrolase, partial [Polyangiaceae bacterium]
MSLSLKAQRVVSRLAELVAIDTRNPGGSERALAEHLCGLLEERRPDAVALREVARPEGNPGEGAYVFARWGTPRVLLNAHLDTVATGDGWTGDPFTLRIEEERVTALGAADTKGAIAAIVTALEEGTPRDCAVLFSGDEEQDSTCMDAFLASELREGIERAIVCEPTGCRVGRRHRGILALAIDVRGEGSHSSLADTLPAPVLEASKV